MPAAAPSATITRMTTDSQSLWRFLFGNWPARIYLAAVAAATGYLVWALATAEGPGGSFAGISLLLLTSPFSWALAFLMTGDGPSWTNAAVYFGGTAICALVNTALISGAYRWITRGSPWPTRAPG
jgi:hypothetical protein